MASASKVLPWVLGSVVAAAGWLQAFHWRSVQSHSSDGRQLEELHGQIASLQRENEVLRLKVGGAPQLPIAAGLIRRVETELELTFLKPPVIELADPDELRGRISAAMEMRFGPGGLDDRQEAWRLMLCLGKDDALLDEWTAVQSIGALTWFDEATGKGVAAKRLDPAAIPSQAALVGLLTRLLLHQHFPPSESYPGDEVARAREALHAGLALGAESRFLSAAARESGFIPLHGNTDRARLLKTLPPFLRGLVTFPINEGKSLADSLFVQGGRPVIEALKQPPVSTRQVLHPGDKLVPVKLEVPVEPLLDESAGELGLKSWLAAHDQAAEIAAELLADRYCLFADGESLAVVWDLRFTSSEAADRWLSAASGIVTHGCGLSEPPQAGKAVVTASGRSVVIHRIDPTSVRFANVAGMETLNKLSP